MAESQGMQRDARDARDAREAREGEGLGKKQERA
jgi:hypothetical protein